MDGSYLALYTEAEHDNFLLDKNKPVQETYEQHTDFSLDTLYIPLNSSSYIGTRYTFSIPVKALSGDLLCNLFLKCSLPTLTGGDSYIKENLGRALLKSISLSLNEVVVEKLVDDWMVVYDEFFLDDNEKKINNLLINDSKNLYIPLNFFFSRRKNKTEFFPLCAVLNQTMYITFEFGNLYDISSAETNYGDIINPVLVFETITLTPYERMNYLKPFTMKIPNVYKEPSSEFSAGYVKTDLTVNFEVSAMFWFFRYKLYETNKDFFINKYDYGYNITNILTEIDAFEYTTIFINNEEVTDQFSSENFYKYLQPISCGLSTPKKNIYMYSFSNNLKDYENGGTYNFANIPSKTSYLTIQIKQERVLDVSQNYSLNVFHYGYSYLRFENGSCSRVYAF